MAIDLRLTFVGCTALLLMAMQAQAQNCTHADALCTPNPGISIRLAESVVKVQTLERGMKGNDIQTLQRLLGHAGFKVKIDGIFGRLTEAAVIAFQKKSGLDVNGRADPKTIEALTN